MTTGESINGYKVVGVRNIIHGKFFPNTNILATFTVKAKRGDKFFNGVEYANGRKEIRFKYSDSEPTHKGNTVYYAETGKEEECIYTL